MDQQLMGYIDGYKVVSHRITGGYKAKGRKIVVYCYTSLVSVSRVFGCEG